jgi:serine protease Do
MKKVLAIVIVISLPLIVGLALGYTLGSRHQDTTPQPVEGLGKVTTASYTAAGERDSVNEQLGGMRRNAITRAVALASPAVVGINVTEVREYQYRDPFSQFFGNDPFFRQYFGDRTVKQEVKGLGSGFIISPDGYILTNDHVAGNAKEITVTLTNKEKYKAELIGTDMLSDISLLKIEGKDLAYLRLGNSDDVIIGEWAIAMGNPFGLFDISDKPTVTVGVVSATGMNLNAEGGRFYRGMIQTDAAINQGNSGGPLMNSAGEVIGVNAVIYTPNQGSIGLGFAIPINRVKTVLAELKKSGKIERNFWIGWEIQSVDQRVARYFGLEKAEGAIIADVKRNSPASRAGLKPGDIITEVNGETIINEDNVTAILVDAKIGDVLRLKVLRNGQPTLINVRLEQRTP